MTPDTNNQFVEHDGQELRFVHDEGHVEVFAWDGSEWKPGHFGEVTEAVMGEDGRHAVIFYRDQGAQGYELFQLQPVPEHVVSFRNTRGKGDGPVFSPDGRWLVMFSMDDNPTVRATGESFEEVSDESDDTPIVVDWATLIAHELPGDDILRIPVGVEIPTSTDPEEVAEWWERVFEALRFESAGGLSLAMPWGEKIQVPLPPPDSITSHGHVTG